MENKRMQFILKNALCVVTLFCALSCDKLSSGQMPVMISPETVVSITTRGPISGTAIPKNRIIMLSAYHIPADESEEPCNYFVSGCFECGRNGLWQATSYWPSTGTLSFLGYSAEFQQINALWDKDDASRNVSFPLADNSLIQDDVLVGCADNTSKCSVLKMDFRHVYALVTFKGCSDADYDSQKNTGVTLNRIIVKGAAFSGDVSIQRTGSDMEIRWSNVGNMKDVEIPDIPMTNLNASPSPVLGKSLLVVPGNQCPVTIGYTIHMGWDDDGNPIDRNMEYTALPDGEWLAGVATNYTVYINVREVRIEPAIAEWIVSPQLIEF